MNGTQGSAPTRTFAAFCCLMAALPLFAQVTDETFEETTDVLEVEVPVNVISKDGTPVRGLSMDDFTLLDEGEKREIVGFRVVDLDVVEPNQTRIEIERAVPSAARRHFLLLFDLSFSTPTAVIRAREAARDFVLQQLHPTDLVGVAMHTIETGGRLLVTFTPDRAQVLRAIDTLGVPQFLQQARSDPLRFLIEDPKGSGFQSSQVSNDNPALRGNQNSLIEHLRVIANEMAKTEKSFDRGRVSSWSRSMGGLARLMDNITGRKHVVYFTQGWDGTLLFGRTPSANDSEFQEDMEALQRGRSWAVDTDNMYGNTSLQGDMADLIEQFRRADCVLQTVDISGLTADPANVERDRQATRAAFFYLSNDTGGALFQDANNFGDQLGEILERSSVTYLLTFRPDEIEYDGEFRDLKVKVDGAKGGRVSHREGYYAPRPYEAMHPLEKRLLASDAIAGATERDDLRIDILTAPFKASERLAYLPIIVEVNGLDLLTGQDGDQLPVEFYAYASNQFGEMKDFFTQMVNLDLTKGREAFERTGLKYYGHLDLPPGDYLVRILVRNADSGRSGVGSVSVAVPEYDQAEPVLLPPFFVESNRDWFLVRESSSSEIPKKVVYPFTVKGEPYIPAALPNLKERQEAQLCLVAYNLGEGDLRLDGSIVAPDGTVMEVDVLSLQERTITGIQGLDKLLATFKPNGLEPGEYTLQVALRNEASGAVETNSIPFTLGISN